MRLRKFAQFAFMPLTTFYCFIAWLMVLLKHKKAIRSADGIVFIRDAGFGHTLHGPDAVRRLHPGLKLVFIVMAAPARHNFHVPKIWPDLTLFFVPVGVSLRLGPFSLLISADERLQGVSGQHIIQKMISPWFINTKPWIAPVNELYDSIPAVPGIDIHSTPLIDFGASTAWTPRYFKLQKDVPMPKVRLPETIRGEIREKLKILRERSSLSHNGKICTLYLRQKDVNSFEKSSSRRSGSSLEAYLPGIKKTIDAGFQVLMTGDHPRDVNLQKEFDGLLVYPESISVKKDLFDLYAGTECDLFVGECGGGSWLPSYNHVPSLYINAYPFFFGRPDARVLFKTLKDEAGSLVNFNEVFKIHVYDPVLLKYEVCANSEVEITEAFEEFLEENVSGVPSKRSANTEKIESLIPRETWFKLSNSRISVAYTRIFERANLL